MLYSRYVLNHLYLNCNQQNLIIYLFSKLIVSPNLSNLYSSQVPVYIFLYPNYSEPDAQIDLLLTLYLYNYPVYI